MSVAYRIPLRELALRINAVLATTTAAMETAYTTSPLTSTQVGSPIFPFTAVVDTLLMAEARFVNVIANSSHPYRSYLRGLTSSVANETAMPTTTSGTVPIVGIPGSVYDATDGTPCVQRPLQEVLIRSRNSGSFFRAPVYWYQINGETVYHTRTNVVIEVCQYNEATQRTAIGANGAMLLPDDLAPALVDEGLRQAFRDDEFISQSGQFGQIADAWIATIQGAPRTAAA